MTMLACTRPNRKGSTGWTWVHCRPTSSIFSRFSPLRVGCLWQNEGAFKRQDIHRCRYPARGGPPVVSHYAKRLVPGGHHEASTTMASIHRTAGRLRRPFLKLLHYHYTSLYFNQVSLNHFWMAWIFIVVYSTLTNQYHWDKKWVDVCHSSPVLLESNGLVNDIFQIKFKNHWSKASPCFSPLWIGKLLHKYKPVQTLLDTSYMHLINLTICLDVFFFYSITIVYCNTVLLTLLNHKVSQNL
jgi:hypothetical protein